MATIDYQDAGLASIQTDAFTQIELFAGDTPAPVTDYALPGGTIATNGLAAWTPVFVDPATRAITLAVAGTTEPNAITVSTVEAGSDANTTVPVYKAGMFNIDALNWPASYDTTAEKLTAFSGATNAQIYVKAPYYS